MIELTYQVEGNKTRVLGDDLNYLMSIDENRIRHDLPLLIEFADSQIKSPSDERLITKYRWLLTRLSLDALYYFQNNDLPTKKDNYFFSGMGGRITIKLWIKESLGKIDFELMSQMLPESPAELEKWSNWYDEFHSNR
ncbi:MAG: hypothetical protein ACPG4Q_11305 [Phycisphaeraceae bacterium]